MKTTKISRKHKKYKEGSLGKDFIIRNDRSLVYEPVKGEKIAIVLQSSFPEYDFIFGVPFKNNPKYKKEVAFFQFRDTRNKKVREGFYLDKTELEDFIEGFNLILKLNKETRKKLWDN